MRRRSPRPPGSWQPPRMKCRRLSAGCSPGELRRLTPPSAEPAQLHQQFRRALSAGGAMYAAAEAANVSPLQSVLDGINGQVQAATGRPLIGNGTNGTPATGQNGTDAGWLIGNGGAGGSGAAGTDGKAGG